MKVSKQCFWYRPSWDNKKGEPRKKLSNGVIFAGPEAIAEKLAERLTSSSALEDDENRKAAARRRKRDDEFLLRAVAEKEQIPLAVA